MSSCPGRPINFVRPRSRHCEGSWALPTIDAKMNIRSVLAPIGPVAVFGPNNFPFAFNGAAGGDFAAAVAAGNPVIAKGHPSHAGTSRLLAEEAFSAVAETGLPAATVQLVYRIKPESGSRLVADSTNRCDGIHGKSNGRPGTEGRRRHRRQADLSRDVERQSGDRFFLARSPRVERRWRRNLSEAVFSAEVNSARILG